MVSRHDRSFRFMQAAFSWDKPPSHDLLNSATESITVTVTMGRKAMHSESSALLTLVAANLLLRLPFHVRLRVPEAGSAVIVPPYTGQSIKHAARRLALDLQKEVSWDKAPNTNEVSITIDTPRERSTFHFAAEGWIARVSAEPLAFTYEGNASAVHTAACVATSECLRAWARMAAALGAAIGQRFERDCARIEAARINLWRPGTNLQGPATFPQLPAIDWVGSGAVTQGALAVLYAMPHQIPTGRIFDPKMIDEPDLNRSILSFVRDIERDKPSVVTRHLEATSELVAIPEKYPCGDDSLPWIVCGADDVAVRPTCQTLWPDALVVVSTEAMFARVTCHRSNLRTFCAGCFHSDRNDDAPAPTIGPTSVLAGAVAVSLLYRLALQDPVPGCIDLLSLRMDSPLGIEETNPYRSPDCQICRSRRQRAS